MGTTTYISDRAFCKMCNLEYVSTFKVKPVSIPGSDEVPAQVINGCERLEAVIYAKGSPLMTLAAAGAGSSDPPTTRVGVVVFSSDALAVPAHALPVHCNEFEFNPNTTTLASYSFAHSDCIREATLNKLNAAVSNPFYKTNLQRIYNYYPNKASIGTLVFSSNMPSLEYISVDHRITAFNAVFSAYTGVVDCTAYVPGDAIPSITTDTTAYMDKRARILVRADMFDDWIKVSPWTTYNSRGQIIAVR